MELSEVRLELRAQGRGPERLHPRALRESAHGRYLEVESLQEPVLEFGQALRMVLDVPVELLLDLHHPVLVLLLERLDVTRVHEGRGLVRVAAADEDELSPLWQQLVPAHGRLELLAVLRDALAHALLLALRRGLGVLLLGPELRVLDREGALLDLRHGEVRVRAAQLPLVF